MMSLRITTTNNNNTTINPARMMYSRVRIEKARPLIASMMLMTMLPPSRRGIGSRFRIAMLIDRNAIRKSSGSIPPRAACTDVRAIAIGPPSCRTDTVPVTRPRTTLSTEPPMSHVEFQPSTTASPKWTGFRRTGSRGPAPIRPTVIGSPVAGSCAGVGSGVIASDTRLPCRLTSSVIGLPGDAVTLSSTSTHEATGAPEIATILSPDIKPAAAAGLPATISFTTAGTNGRP